jgi:AraC-like DNA-binding protein
MLSSLPPKPFIPARAATPMAFARQIVKAYEHRHRCPSNALMQAQITPARLLEPHGKITATQFESLSACAMQELDDEGLGAFSRRLPWGSYGMLARASITSPTLGVALQRWCRHHALIAEDVQVHLSCSGERATISVAPGSAVSVGEFATLHLLRNILGLACWMVDSRIPLTAAGFSFSAPPHAAAYPLLFGPATAFDCECSFIEFDARYLSLALRRDEKSLQHMLKRALPLTVRQYRRDRLLVPQVRQALMDARHPSQTAANVARSLHLSERSLHRQLREENASLQQIKDEVRSRIACGLLLATKQPIKKIAAATGFRNEKSFIRAFGSWTGSTPSNFRRQPTAARSLSG